MMHDHVHRMMNGGSSAASPNRSKFPSTINWCHAIMSCMVSNMASNHISMRAMAHGFNMSSMHLGWKPGLGMWTHSGRSLDVTGGCTLWEKGVRTTHTRIMRRLKRIKVSAEMIRHLQMTQVCPSSGHQCRRGPSGGDQRSFQNRLKCRSNLPTTNVSHGCVTTMNNSQQTSAAATTHLLE